MKAKIILFLSFLIMYTATWAQVSEAWSVTYQKFQGSNVTPIDMAIASDNSIYVVAKCPTELMNPQMDYCLIKYSPQGEQQWTEFYDGPKHTKDMPSAIAIGAQGNIYLTGLSTGLGDVGKEICTIKYSPSGERQWVARAAALQGLIGNPAPGLVLDQESNVYVTGSSRDRVLANSGSDFFTLKYDEQGKKLWEVAFDKSVSNDHAHAITLDAEGNMIVVGASQGPAHDITTIKYKGQEELWAKHYEGPTKNKVAVAVNSNTGSASASAGNVAAGAGRSIPNVVRTDDQGNIYVAGYILGQSGEQDYILIKYSAKGNEQWVQQYNGPANGYDEIRQMSIDEEGNILVTGFSENNDRTSTYSYCTIKYNPLGEQLWLQRTPPAIHRGQPLNYLPDMVLDNAGNVYITGRNLLGNLLTTKYGAQGNKAWEITSGNLGGGAFAIDLDSQNNVVVSGFTFDNAGMPMITVKYAQQ